MTTVREHKSQHDAISDLPLVTESATVTDVSSLDRDRRDELQVIIQQWLAGRSLGEQYASLTKSRSWGQLCDALIGDGYHKLARHVATVSERFERPKPMLTRVRFKTKREFEYLAGQYVGLRYKGNSRAYSLASSPTRDSIEICVRRVPSGRLSPRICDELALGDAVTLRGPHGDLVLQDPSERDIVFLATGTGVAPFKGMIDYLFDVELDEHGSEKRNVWLFLGAAWEDDLPYREEFRRLASDEENFYFVPTVSREPYLGTWTGETDYVQNALLKYVDETTVTGSLDRRVEQWIRRTPESDVQARLDPSNMEVYACGTNTMVYSLVEAVESLGVSEDWILCEGFG